MEISFSSLNHKTGNLVPIIPKTRLSKMNLKVNVISSRVQELNMQTQATDLYQVLSLESKNVGFDEIKKAYRSLVLQYHPDLFPSSQKEESTRKFVELQKAYETLSDPVARETYDYQLRLGGEASSTVSKEVLENQLYGLHRRSMDRMAKKKNKYM